jgi:DNA-binding Lrp family transcriptional regulator
VVATNLNEHNQALILTTVYAHEAVSRVQLARLTHLSRSAVTEITHNLLESGLIREIGSEMIPAKVGKRATLLKFNPVAYHVVAADVGGSLIRLGDTLFDKIKHTVRESALQSLASQIDILPSNLGDHMVLLGVGALVMERELGLWQF